jgi:hypothetical protein
VAVYSNKQHDPRAGCGGHFRGLPGAPCADEEDVLSSEYRGCGEPMLIRHVTDTEIAGARAQPIPSPTPGSAESAPNRYHHPGVRKMRD